MRYALIPRTYDPSLPTDARQHFSTCGKAFRSHCAFKTQVSERNNASIPSDAEVRSILEFDPRTQLDFIPPNLMFPKGTTHSIQSYEFAAKTP